MNKLLHVAMAAVLGAGLLASTLGPAEAGRRGGAIAGGIIGGVALGLLLGGSRAHGHYGYSPACYEGRPQCRLVRDCWVDRYGYQRCGDRQECHRPVYCD